MPTNVTRYARLAEETAVRITGSYLSWTDFLNTAARLYKYPYHEQLLIYAQRPEATACASFDIWNRYMGRYIRRGAKGIALIDSSGDTPKLKYVFDVSDTGGSERSRSPNLWSYRPEHEQAVSADLEHQFSIPGTGDFAEQLEQISYNKATEYFLSHQQGNRNKEVQIYQYVTEGTFDAYLWQTLENKQKFISQIMTSKSRFVPVRMWTSRRCPTQR